MTIGKGLFMSLVLGLLSTLSASGADLPQVAAFSTVLTEIAQQAGGDHLMVSGDHRRMSRISRCGRCFAELKNESGP